MYKGTDGGDCSSTDENHTIVFMYAYSYTQTYIHTYQVMYQETGKTSAVLMKILPLLANPEEAKKLLMRVTKGMGIIMHRSIYVYTDYKRCISNKPHGRTMHKILIYVYVCKNVYIYTVYIYILTKYI